ncbi:lyase family protein [Nonomuraea rubra]|uniref:aspartate ammonia-lyase n=1 Tax=Nonomuraea rubra TaxID=46180 RepID=A0A7X0NWK8_9ACTN|nr:lyase family protein [Nonomuraea rubra]MBB6550940.1 fumarate hydratase class II [Nonomuraea rubra]
MSAPPQVRDVPIGDDRMPKAVYHAYGHIKKAAAIVNARAGRLPRWQADLISRVADEVVSGELDSEFPLYVRQTGSGTQSNMNVNEVISNQAIQLVRLDTERLHHNLDHSIMMVTALSPIVGYDQAARIAHHALDHGLSLKDAALQCGVAEKLYDRIVKPENLTRPGVPSPDGGRRRSARAPVKKPSRAPDR